MIRIIDYGVGNVAAFLNMYRRMNIQAERATTASHIDGATCLLLPGVGSFDHAMRRFADSGMRESVEQRVAGGVPVLGVCVGMQMMAHGSDEGEEEGLGWIDGRVRSFRSAHLPANLPLPHMGWNDVTPVSGAELFVRFEAKPRFYFLHSFYFDCVNSVESAATSEYGIAFDSVVSRGNIHGVQFHPEKSHRFGAQLLRNFAEMG